MTLASAFSTAWKDLKATAAKVANAVTRNSADHSDGGHGRERRGRGYRSVSRRRDHGFRLTGRSDRGKDRRRSLRCGECHQPVESLFGEAWPAIKSLMATLENHPTVASVTAALESSKGHPPRPKLIGLRRRKIDMAECKPARRRSTSSSVSRTSGSKRTCARPGFGRSGGDTRRECGRATPSLGNGPRSCWRRMWPQWRPTCPK